MSADTLAFNLEAIDPSPSTYGRVERICRGEVNEWVDTRPRLIHGAAPSWAFSWCGFGRLEVH